MDFTKLKINIIEMLREQQIKLGYMRETVRLYYPLQSLNRFLGSTLDVKGMEQALGEFAAGVKDDLGTIEISVNGERFCLACGPDVADYVKDHMEGAQFLTELIHLIATHGTSIDEVLELFSKYSDKVHTQKDVSDEFDYLVYFEDGVPDDFRYCLTDEGEHLIYHRFTADDYHDIYEV